MSASAAKATETRTILPPIPAKRYFTIGEVSELCGVKPHVLRYWEQEFTQLRPMKRRGNRRYYQHHEVLLIRRIRELLYEHGFTISGARNRLAETAQPGRKKEAELTQPVDITLSLRQSDVEAIRQDLMVALDLLRDALGELRLAALEDRVAAVGGTVVWEADTLVVSVPAQPPAAADQASTSRSGPNAALGT